MVTYVFEHHQAIAGISLTFNTQSDCFKADLAIFRKKY